MEQERALRWIVMIMTVMTFGWTVQRIIMGVSDSALIRLMAIGLVIALVFELYLLIYLLLSRRRNP